MGVLKHWVPLFVLSFAIFIWCHKRFFPGWGGNDTATLWTHLLFEHELIVLHNALYFDQEERHQWRTNLSVQQSASIWTLHLKTWWSDRVKKAESRDEGNISF